MQGADFETAILNIIRRDDRFDPQAYIFLKDALDFTQKRAVDSGHSETNHVSGRELALGFRDLALQDFGPMASTLMGEWGLTSTRNIGEMVFQLIEERMFGKQEDDKLEDFEDIYDFEDAFVLPFTPSSRRPTTGAETD